MAQKRLTSGSESEATGQADALRAAPPVAEDERDAREAATEADRFRYYLAHRSFAAVARAFGVSPQAISAQADRHEWRERAIEHDRKLGLNRKAVASAKTLRILEQVEGAVEAEAASWDEADGEVDKLSRAAGAIQVIERVQKVQSTALDHLPEEKPALDCTPLTDEQLVIMRAFEDLEAAMRAHPGRAIVARPGTPLALLEALVRSPLAAELAREAGTLLLIRTGGES